MADLEEVDVSKNIDEDDDEIQLSEPEQDVEEDDVEEGEIPENDDDLEDGEIPENDDDELEEGEVYEGDNQEIKLKNQEELAKLSIPENEEKVVEDSDSSDSDDEDSLELQKIETDIDKSTLLIYHPELKQINYKELLTLSKITRNKKGIIIDPLHKTIPFLTRYEKAKILGLRAKQINNGSDPFVDVPRNIINGHTIALMELNEKKIPFIIKRPLPNGGNEYWKVKDLQILE